MPQFNHLPCILQESSPLRRVPQTLSHKEQVFLDGILYSIEIADLAYRRLRETLWDLSNRTGPHPSTSEYAVAVSDAWVIVDSLSRLQALCKSAPKISKANYCMRLLESLSNVKLLRNSVQHLDGRADAIVSRKEPVWGALSWAVVDENPPIRGQLHTFVAGSFRPGEHEFVETGGREFVMPIDAIQIRAANVSVNLSDLMLATAHFAAQLEMDLTAQFPADAPTGRDLHMVATITFSEWLGPASKLTIALK